MCVWGGRIVCCSLTVERRTGLWRILLFGDLTVRVRCRAARIDRSAKFLEGSEMTSGNIQLGPDPDRILEALKVLLRDDPGARRLPAEEVAKELVRGGYLQEDPDPVLVAEMLEGLEAEEQSLQADEVPEGGTPT